jgi:hypothetical protein
METGRAGRCATSARQSCERSIARGPQWPQSRASYRTRSLGHATRFVVDHAPCAVMLVWPRETPAIDSIPPPKQDIHHLPVHITVTR